MKYVIPTVIIGVLIVYFFVLGSDDAKEIEKVFDNILNSAREKDHEGVLEGFSIHYDDEYGYNYLVIKRIIENAFNEFDSMEGSYENLKVQISEGENGEKVAYANVDVSALGVRGGIPKALLGGDGGYDNIDVTLKKSTLGPWKIIEVRGIDKYSN